MALRGVVGEVLVWRRAGDVRVFLGMSEKWTSLRWVARGGKMWCFLVVWKFAVVAFLGPSMMFHLCVVTLGCNSSQSLLGSGPVLRSLHCSTLAVIVSACWHSHTIQCSQSGIQYTLPISCPLCKAITTLIALIHLQFITISIPTLMRRRMLTF
jgi:hypothetical protein